MRFCGYFAALAAGVAVLAGASVATAQTPKRGGILTHTISADPPNLDCHQSNSAQTPGVVKPVYSTLIRFDQNDYPTIVGDLASSWTISPDGLTYTFKLQPNVKFHDGTPFTSADVKASFDRIHNPPAGVASLRKFDFADVAAIETPDELTAVFKLSQGNAALLDLIANPLNCIYSARRLTANQKSPETEAIGTGPFTFTEYRRGAYAEGKRFDGYFRAGLPYLDGYRALITADNAGLNALAGGQTDGILRGLQPQALERLREQLGDKISASQTSILSLSTQAVANVKRKPFDDVRVRRALALAIDHRGGLAAMRKITNQDTFGGPMRPGYDLALSDSQLEKLPGFGRDIAAARAEARRLLAEAGQSNLKVQILNRDQGVYIPLAVFLIDQWRSIGVTVEQDPEPAPVMVSRLAAGDFDIAMDTNSSTSDDPTIMLSKYVPGAPANFGGSTDPTLIDLFKKQKAILDHGQRRGLINDFESRVLDQAYYFPLFFAGNTPAIRSYVKNWKTTPVYLLGYELTEVWKDQ